MKRVGIRAHDTSRRAHFLVGRQGKGKEEIALYLTEIILTAC